MKAIKSLLALALIALSTLANAQAVSLTSTTPINQIPNNWPNGNSWLMLLPIYNDLVTLNNATNSSANASFTTISPLVATTGLTLSGVRANVVSDSVITKVTLTAAQSGSVILLKALAGDTVQLPTATTANLGVKFVIINTYSSTSVGHCIMTAGNDVFWGNAIVTSVTTPFCNPFLSTTNKIMLMTPTTTGGLAGGRTELVCLGAGRWSISAVLYGSSTPATPFK